MAELKKLEEKIAVAITDLQALGVISVSLNSKDRDNLSVNITSAGDISTANLAMELSNLLPGMTIKVTVKRPRADNRDGL